MTKKHDLLASPPQRLADRVAVRPVAVRRPRTWVSAGDVGREVCASLMCGPARQEALTARAGNGDPMSRPIQLHGDLTVDPAREAEMVTYFETVYRPKAGQFPGYIDLHLLKLTGAPMGTPRPA